MPKGNRIYRPPEIPSDLARDLDIFQEGLRQGLLPIVEGFIEKYHGRYINIANNQGKTPLHLIAETSHTEIATALLDAGAAIEDGDKNNRTPLIIAAKHGRAKMVKTFLAYGAKTNSATRQGMTAVFCAAAAGKPRALGLLIEAGANIEIPDEGGKTPLMAAAEKGRLQTMRPLLVAEASYVREDHEGRHAKTYAVMNRHDDAADLLDDEPARRAKLRANIVADFADACHRGTNKNIHVIGRITYKNLGLRSAS